MRPIKVSVFDKKELFEEWHPTKNGSLDPKRVGTMSRTTVWWKCKKCGNEWHTRPSHRVHDKTGCKKCSSVFFKNEMPVAQSHIHLLKEWHPTKNSNNNFNLYDVGIGSGRKAWWICQYGHEWEAAICSRRVSGCPYCAGRKVNGENCLETTHPEIALEWDYEKNKPLLPSEITKGNDKSIWWKCDKGHSWKTTTGVRTSQNTGCPYCCGNLFSPERSLSSINPQLAKEWHSLKNGNLLPSQISFNSKNRVWWKCKNGHEWKTKVSHRNGGHGCPYCNKVELKDGTVWDSKIEAIIYLYLKKMDIQFVWHKLYANEGFGKRDMIFIFQQ